jgi:hypothetical protein
MYKAWFFVWIFGFAPVLGFCLEPEGNFEVKFNADYTLTILRYTGRSQEVIVPEKIQGVTVTIIGRGAFSSEAHHNQYTGIKRLALPKSIKKIGISAFYGLKALSSINIPQGVEIIGQYAFAGCASLKSIVIPDSVKYLGLDPDINDQMSDNGYTFAYSGLSEIKLPAGITELRRGTFRGCKFSAFVIPEGVTAVQDLAFANCGNLANITFPASLKTLGTQSFASCPSLTGVNIPQSIANLDFGHAVFWESKNLSLFSQAALKQRGWNGRFDLI